MLEPHGAASSPKKKKMDLEIAECSKRQLFKDDTVKLELVDSAQFEGSAPPDSKSGDENVAKKPEIKSRHPCTVCSKVFNTPGKLNQHMFSHTGEKPFVCSHCSKAFSSKFKLVRHILIHSDQRQHRCNVCERTFHRKDHLKNHSKVHSPIKRRFKCDREDCGKEYSSILSYRKHIAVHSAEEGNLECKICGKKFETKEDTLFHLKVHAGSRSLKTPADRKYRCDHCDRSFFTGKDVRRHLVVHTGRRDFLCQYCPQRFGRKDHLTRHIKKSHSASTKKAKARKPLETEKSCKSIDNILLEMFDEKSSLEERSDRTSVSDMVPEELYKMPGLESPLDSSSDIMPIVTIDDKAALSSKMEENLGMYNVPMLDATNIPYPKYDHYPFENFAYNEESDPLAGPSTSHAILPGLMYQQPQPPSPYPASELTATFNPDSGVDIKVESDFSSENQPNTLDLVLPPITNISPSMGGCLLTNADLQNLLTPGGPPSTEAEGDDSRGAAADSLFNFLPNSNELIASLLPPTSQDSQTNSTPLPGFSQAFHQPP